MSLVYAQSPRANQWVDPAAPDGMEWLWSTDERFLARCTPHTRLLSGFRRLLDAGSIGVVLFDGSECAAYAWMSTPRSQLPAHLPMWLGGKFWIYFCHTAEAYRGRGFYRCALRNLTAAAASYEQDRDSVVYIDTDVTNAASQRGIQRAGFELEGRLVTYRIPGTKRVFGSWAR